MRNRNEEEIGYKTILQYPERYVKLSVYAEKCGVARASIYNRYNVKLVTALFPDLFLIDSRFKSPSNKSGYRTFVDLHFSPKPCRLDSLRGVMTKKALRARV